MTYRRCSIQTWIKCTIRQQIWQLMNIFILSEVTNFMQNMPSKSAKHKIKILWICHAENARPLYGIIYSEKTGNVCEKIKEKVVKEPAAWFKRSGGNITMNHYFTNLPLAKHLLTQKLIYIPKQVAAHQSREEYCTLFCFHEHIEHSRTCQRKKNCNPTIDSSIYSNRIRQTHTHWQMAYCYVFRYLIRRRRHPETVKIQWNV